MTSTATTATTATPAITPARWALITGASRGIGRAIAVALARDGCSVLLNYRSNHAAAEAAREAALATAAAGVQVRLCPFDVCDAAGVEAAFAGFQQEGLHISVVVNNAGIAADGPFPTQSWEDWERVTRTTLDGFYRVTRPLVMPMVRKRWGRIINISSVSGVIGNRGQVNYSAAKAGLIGATRSLAQELARRKVTVNAVAPGLIETEMIADVPKEVVRHIPMRRIGQPEEVAELVAFLASDKAAYITGQVIGINGGLA